MAKSVKKRLSRLRKHVIWSTNTMGTKDVNYNLVGTKGVVKL